MNIAEFAYLIREGKNNKKNSLRVITQRVEPSVNGYPPCIVFELTGKKEIENYLKQEKYSFKYETYTEQLPAKYSCTFRSDDGFITLKTTALVVEL